MFVKNILVTGSHRSGSTWVGNVIAKSKKVRYIREPFNIIEDYHSPFINQFEHLNNRPLSEQKKAKNYLNSFYLVFHRSTFYKLLKIRSLRDGRRFLSDVKSRFTRRSLFKDPLAVMSAEWIYKNYGWDVIVLIRHPAAFVASLKVKDWQFNFNYFLNQENLMSTMLKDYSEIIYEYSNNKKDIIDQGILLWNVIYAMVYSYRRKYAEKWYFIKHEDLSINPLSEFDKIFKFLHLDFDENVKEFIIESTTSREETILKRDSQENIKSWKNRLSLGEIDQIKEGTKNVWTNFYSENDW